jgi:hypothetical protein
MPLVSLLTICCQEDDEDASPKEVPADESDKRVSEVSAPTPTDESSDEEESSSEAGIHKSPSFRELDEDDPAERRASSIARDESLANVLDDLAQADAAADAISLPPSSPPRPTQDTTSEPATLVTSGTALPVPPAATPRFARANAHSTPAIRRPPQYQVPPLSKSDLPDPIEEDEPSVSDPDLIETEEPVPPVAQDEVDQEVAPPYGSELDVVPSDDAGDAEDDGVGEGQGSDGPAAPDLEEDTEATPAPVRLSASKPAPAKGAERDGSSAQLPTPEPEQDAAPPSSAPQPTVKRGRGRPKLTDEEIRHRAEKKERLKAEKAKAESPSKADKQTRRRPGGTKAGSEVSGETNVATSKSQPGREPPVGGSISMADASMVDWATLARGTSEDFTDGHMTMVDQLRSSSPELTPQSSQTSKAKRAKTSHLREQKQADSSMNGTRDDNPASDRPSLPKLPASTQTKVNQTLGPLATQVDDTMGNGEDDVVPMPKRRNAPPVSTQPGAASPLTSHEESADDVQMTPLFLPSESQLAYPYTQTRPQRPTSPEANARSDDEADPTPVVRRQPSRPSLPGFKSMKDIFGAHGSLFSSPLMQVASGLSASQPARMPSTSKSKLHAHDEESDDDNDSSDSSDEDAGANRSHIPSHRRASAPPRKRKKSLANLWSRT